MVEIFTGKAVGAFEETGVTTAVATRYATFSFFFGMLLTWALDKLVHALSDIPQAIQRIKVGMDGAVQASAKGHVCSTPLLAMWGCNAAAACMCPIPR
jgi:hypothetical protein